MKMKPAFLAVSSALLAFAAVLAVAETAAVKDAPPPVLTQAESLHIENIQLKMTILRQQEMQLQQEYEGVVQEVQREHPGYTLNRQTNQLIALPKPEAAKPAPANADKK